MGPLGTVKAARARNERAICALLCVLIAALTCEPPSARGQTQGPAGGKPENTAGAERAGSDYIHGTIDVVVSTKDGFVLATDSRATHADGTHSDDTQKLFTVGARAACVIAGTVGAEIGVDGFNLRDAIGSHLLLMDRSARANVAYSDAYVIARAAGEAFGSVIGLLSPNAAVVRTIAGEVAAVSVTESGEPAWTSFVLPIVPMYAQGVNYWTVGTPVWLLHSPSTLGLRFDVDAIGQPSVALKLLHASEPGEDAFSRSQIMRRFYRLKKRGRLDDFRLRDGIALARVLEEATIALAPASSGVGGPIDIMTLSKAGQTWIQRKGRPAPFPPPYLRQFFGESFESGGQTLDGLQCLACSFKNVRLAFNGDADVELVQARFDGACQLTLGPHARERMPRTVQLLENLLRGKCEIIADQGH